MHNFRTITASSLLVVFTAAADAAVDLGNNEWLLNFDSYGGGAAHNPFTGAFGEGPLSIRPVNQNGETVTATDEPTYFFTRSYVLDNVAPLTAPALLPNVDAGVYGVGIAESSTQNPYGTGIFELLSITFIASGADPQPIKVSYLLEDGTPVSQNLLIGPSLDNNIFDPDNVFNFSGIPITDFNYVSLGAHTVSVDDIKVRVNIEPNVSSVPAPSSLKNMLGGIALLAAVAVARPRKSTMEDGPS